MDIVAIVNIDNIERLPGLVHRGTERFGDSIAFVNADLPDDGLSYRSWHHRVACGAWCLRSLQGESPRPVLLCMESSPHWERFWDRCTLFDVNFQPKNMTVEQLEEGMRWLFKEIYNEGEFNKRRRHHMEIVKAQISSPACFFPDA